MRPLPAVLLTLVTPWSLVGQAYTISTFAGGGLPGNIPGTSASLYGPQAIAVDGAGNVFVADGGDVLRLDAAKGVLTLVAGNGTLGYSGDNGLATSAQLGARGVAVDSAGNLFIADARNNRVRKISNGVITTVAGSGTKGYSGDNGPATNAQLYSPLGVAVDSGGSLYIADAGNYCVRKVSNGVITTVAGNGRYGYSGDNGPATSAQFAAPDAVAVDPDGNLYIADVSNNRIRKVSNGVVTTVAGNGTAGFSGDGGPATSARFEYPSGVALDSAGNLYIADCDNNRIRKVSNGVITTVAGNGAQGYSGDNGPATGAHLVCPGAVAVDSSGSLYIADTLNFRIRKVSAGLITTVAGNGTPGFSGDNGPATSAQLSAPQGGMAVDSAGSLYFADTGNNRIRKILNGVITTVAGSGTEGYSGDNGPATNAQLYSPLGVAVDSAGNLYIADNSNARIRKVSNGVITTVAGNGTFGYGGDGGPATGAELQQPWGVAVDAAGSLYIADTDNARIRKVSNGVITTVAGNGTHGYGGDYGPATSAQLGSPYGVAVDPVGSLYIADTYCNCIREVSNGVITTVAGNGTAGFSGDGGPATRAELQQPWGVAVDAAGSLYIADLDNLRIRKVSSGVITTVAGGGDQFGDNGPATGAQLAGAGVAVDSAGNVYIADNGNNRIRLLTPGTPPAIFRRRSRSRLWLGSRDSTRLLGLDLRKRPGERNLRLEPRLPNVSRRHKRDHRRQAGIPVVRQPHSDQPPGTRRYGDWSGERGCHNGVRNGSVHRHAGGVWSLVQPARRRKARGRGDHDARWDRRLRRWNVRPGWAIQHLLLQYATGEGGRNPDPLRSRFRADNSARAGRTELLRRSVH